MCLTISGRVKVPFQDGKFTAYKVVAKVNGKFRPIYFNDATVYSVGDVTKSNRCCRTIHEGEEFTMEVNKGIHVLLELEAAQKVLNTLSPLHLLKVECDKSDFVAAGYWHFNDEIIFESAVFMKVRVLREVSLEAAKL